MGNIENRVHIFRISLLAVLWVQIVLLSSFHKIDFSFPRNTLEGTVCSLVDINLNFLILNTKNTANLAHTITQAIFNSNFNAKGGHPLK